MITAPGVYDIEEDAYHSDPCPEPSLSASMAKKMIARSPRHGWFAHPRLNPDFEPETDDTMDKGKCFHKEILGKGAELVICDFDSWRTKESKAAKEAARTAGKTPILAEKYEEVRAMRDAARWQMREFEELAYAMNGGTAERALIWIEETRSGPIWCRAMIDWHPMHGHLFPDWKSTMNSAQKWGERTMWDEPVQADIQDAFYRRGIKALLGINADLIFPVIEMQAPYAMAVHRVDPEAQAEADKMIEWAIEAFAMCKARNAWPGYSTMTQWQYRPRYQSQTIELKRASGPLDISALEQNLDILKQISEAPRPEGGVPATEANPLGLAPAS